MLQRRAVRYLTRLANLVEWAPGSSGQSGVRERGRYAKRDFNSQFVSDFHMPLVDASYGLLEQLYMLQDDGVEQIEVFVPTPGTDRAIEGYVWLRISMNINQTIDRAEALGDSRCPTVNCTQRSITEELIRSPAHSALKSMQIVADAVAPGDAGARRSEYIDAVQWATDVLSSNFTVHKFHSHVVGASDETGQCPHSPTIVGILDAAVQGANATTDTGYQFLRELSNPALEQGRAPATCLAPTTPPPPTTMAPEDPTTEAPTEPETTEAPTEAQCRPETTEEPTVATTMPRPKPCPHQRWRRARNHAPSTMAPEPKPCPINDGARARNHAPSTMAPEPETMPRAHRTKRQRRRQRRLPQTPPPLRFGELTKPWHPPSQSIPPCFLKRRPVLSSEQDPLTEEGCRERK